jgi:hypothetical protein
MAILAFLWPFWYMSSILICCSKKNLSTLVLMKVLLKGSFISSAVGENKNPGCKIGLGYFCKFVITVIGFSFSKRQSVCRAETVVNDIIIVIFSPKIWRKIGDF